MFDGGEAIAIVDNDEFSKTLQRRRKHQRTKERDGGGGGNARKHASGGGNSTTPRAGCGDGEEPSSQPHRHFNDNAVTTDDSMNTPRDFSSTAETPSTNTPRDDAYSNPMLTVHASATPRNANSNSNPTSHANSINPVVSPVEATLRQSHRGHQKSGSDVRAGGGGSVGDDAHGGWHVHTRSLPTSGRDAINTTRGYAPGSQQQQQQATAAGAPPAATTGQCVALPPIERGRLRGQVLAPTSVNNNNAVVATVNGSSNTSAGPSSRTNSQAPPDARASRQARRQAPAVSTNVVMNRTLTGRSASQKPKTGTGGGAGFEVLDYASNDEVNASLGAVSEPAPAGSTTPRGAGDPSGFRQRKKKDRTFDEGPPCDL